jgi:hypothetical protein
MYAAHAVKSTSRPVTFAHPQRRDFGLDYSSSNQLACGAQSTSLSLILEPLNIPFKIHVEVFATEHGLALTPVSGILSARPLAESAESAVRRLLTGTDRERTIFR